MSHCSEIIDAQVILKVRCVHCEVINYISQTLDDDDPTKFDIEAITCWGCNRDSLIDDVLLEMYPEFPNEQVSGHFEGKSAVNYT